MGREAPFLCAPPRSLWFSPSHPPYQGIVLKKKVYRLNHTLDLCEFCVPWNSFSSGKRQSLLAPPPSEVEVDHAAPLEVAVVERVVPAVHGPGEGGDVAGDPAEEAARVPGRAAQAEGGHVELRAS